MSLLKYFQKSGKQNYNSECEKIADPTRSIVGNETTSSVLTESAQSTQSIETSPVSVTETVKDVDKRKNTFEQITTILKK